jgi:hypothetical protein
MDFMTSSAVYECSNGTSYVGLRVHHSGFYRLSKEVSRMRRLCDDEGALSDPHVDRFLRAVERYRYQVSAAPISFSGTDLSIPEVLAALAEDGRAIGVGWPRLDEICLGLISLLADLTADDSAPYLECAACARCKPNVGREAMVVCPTNLLTAARDTADNLIGAGALTLLAPSELKSGPTYDRLLMAGPFSWFARRAAHVLTAPRAREMVSVSYDWLPDNWRPDSTFVQSEICAAYAPKAPVASSCPIMPTRAEVEVLDEEVLPSSEALFDGFSSSAATRQRNDYESDPVPTRGFLLEPASMLLVEDDPESRMLAIDFSREPGRQVVKMRISEIVPGVFVLHRSVGGGDFVVDLANRILGSRRDHLRGRQALWKDRLRPRAMRDGYEQVARELESCGSKIASYQNVRNWVSARNIATSDQVDFDAIMRFVGLEDQADSLWQEMKEIRGAHLRAGQQIARMLLREVARADLSQLLRLGYGDFDLGDDDGGVLTAQRVIEVVQTTPPCLESNLPLFRDV